MAIKLLMTLSEVEDYAFATGEYINEGDITQSHILAVQQRYMVPVLGEALCEAIAAGKYETLREDFIAPTLGLFTRIEAELNAYPPTKSEKQRGKLFLKTLSEYLNANADSFEEYDPEENVMNRCELVGGFVL